MYRLYGRVASRAFRVLWAMEEMGLNYEQVPVRPHAPELASLSPSGKIPVLDVDGTALTDSTAIMTYLADHHGRLTYPAGTLDRGRQDGWTERLNDEFDSVLWTAVRHKMMLPEDRRVPDVIPALQWEFGQNLARLAADFRGPFLMGDDLTIPDILLGHCLGWAVVMGWPIESDTLKAYSKALRSRPAYKAAAAQE